MALDPAQHLGEGPACPSLQAATFAELRLGGWQSDGPHHSRTPGMPSADGAAHAHVTNTELPKLFIAEEPEGKAHPQLLLGREGCG